VRSRFATKSVLVVRLTACSGIAQQTGAAAQPRRPFLLALCYNDRTMRNSELIGCEFSWRRDGADWILLHKRRRMGRVAPDSEHCGMYRVVLSRGRLSDMANLSWAKDAALAAAIRELEWKARDMSTVSTNHRATDPAKCPEKRGPSPATAPLIHFSSNPAEVMPSSTNANPESLTAYSSAII